MLSLNPAAASYPKEVDTDDLAKLLPDGPSSSRCSTSAISTSITSIVVRPPENKLVSKSAAMKHRGDESARSDKPQINYKTRGNQQYALKVAEDPGLLEDAVKKYDKDARSAGDTSDFHVRTWRQYHDRVSD